MGHYVQGNSKGSSEVRHKRIFFLKNAIIELTRGGQVFRDSKLVAIKNKMASNLPTTFFLA